MKLFNFCNKVIEYSFYLIFFLIPLALAGDTSELFEFNKLWLTFILTIVIGFAWFTKMVIRKQFRIQKTPLDIPIALFLVSQIISSFFSLDTHVSFWGYYSRFNGGLFSIFAYVFLYYAFISNLLSKQTQEEEKEEDISINRIMLFFAAIIVFFIGAVISSKIQNAPSAGTPFQLLATMVTALISFFMFMKASPKGILKRSLYIIFSSEVLVVLWGLPSHFGYDPTCFLFRGTFDVSCWTSSFQPKVRMFSTLGQPDWAAAYLGILLPILVAIFINFSKTKLAIGKKTALLKNNNLLFAIGLGVLFLLSYLGLLFTVSRSAIFGFWLSFLLLLTFYFWFYIKPKISARALDFRAFIVTILIVASVTFFVGTPFSQIDILTLRGISQKLQKTTTNKPTPTANKTQTAVFATELGGTDSGIIRSYVWKGAIDIWKNYPIFGSGLETYAFAYYKFKPVGHNLTSEWNYLYNKAHNEFLNYLATTGTVGILTYLSMIGLFMFLSLKYLYEKNNKSQKDFLIASFIAAYLVILITNFFGFSVVIVNIFFYLIPAFVFAMAGLINYEKGYTLNLTKNETYTFNVGQKITVAILAAVAIYLINYLITFWNSDRNYYFGQNYDNLQDYQKAYPFLQKAVSQTPNEPVFKDEYAYNNAVLGAAILAQSQGQTQQNIQNTQIAKQLIETGINTTNQLTTEHPNNIVFWKTKVRIYYTLAQIDSSYYAQALNAIKTAATLAPTDPDVFYNLGVLYGQTGDLKNAILYLQKTIQLKPDYKGGQAYYALGIFYRQLAVDSKGKVINPEYNQKAIDEMRLMEKLFGKNQQADDALKAWGAR
jgi:tetratricopeptide (TPR) repeat protein